MILPPGRQDADLPAQPDAEPAQTDDNDDREPRGAAPAQHDTPPPESTGSPPASDLQQPLTFVTPSIAIGGYQGPMSVKAAAAFAAGARPGAGLPGPSGFSQPAPSKIGVALLAAAFLLLLAASGAAFWWRLRMGSQAVATPLELESATSSTSAPTSAPIAPTGAAASPPSDPSPATTDSPAP